MPRRTLFLLLALWTLAARPARAAEEVFVLDNGSVFRGHVVRVEDETVRVRLSGFGRDAIVALEKARIVNRFVPAAAPPVTSQPQTAFKDWTAATRQATAEEKEASKPPPLPAEEPDIHDESFFQRLARVTVLALPASTGGRAALGLLFLFVVVALIFLGARLVEVETMTTGIALLLGVLLAAAFVLDMIYYRDMLRADRAPWLLPLQAILWLGVASAALRCGFERVIVLFAFVSFSLAVAVFAAGAVLVAY